MCAVVVDWPIEKGQSQSLRAPQVTPAFTQMARSAFSAALDTSLFVEPPRIVLVLLRDILSPPP